MRNGTTFADFLNSKKLQQNNKTFFKILYKGMKIHTDKYSQFHYEKIIEKHQPTQGKLFLYCTD